MEKRGAFLQYIKERKFSAVDFLEALAFLPFGFGIVRILSGKFDAATFVILAILLSIYAPILFVFLDWRRKE